MAAGTGHRGTPAVAGTIQVLIASPLEAEHVARIAAADPRIRVAYEPGLLPVPRYPADHTGTPRRLTGTQRAHWARLLASADVSFDFDWQDPAGMPANCPRLRWVQATSAGIGEFVARNGLSPWPVTLTTAAGVHAVPLAEFTLLGLLYFAKDVPRLRRWQAARHWERHATGQLAGSRALLVGLGSIGREIARLLCAAGVEVWGAGRAGGCYDVPGVARYLAEDGIDAALPDVDALILACPLTPRTEGLIGAARLRLLREGAVLVNVSRGRVVDEDALAGALRGRHLRGACLDVFAAEPLPSGSPLWELGNVLISPHSAATVAAENRLLTDLFIDNLRRWLSGAPLRNVYDPGRGY